MNMQTKEHIRCRITLPVIIGGALTVAALSTGSTVFLTGAVLVWLLQGLAQRNLPVIGDFLAQIVDLVQHRTE